MSRKQKLWPLPEVKNGEATSLTELLKANPAPVAIKYFVYKLQRALPSDYDLMMRSLDEVADAGSWSRITAKFNSTCAFCRGEIQQGTSVVWLKSAYGGSMVAHYNCLYEAAHVENMDTALLQEAVDVLRKKLEETRQCLEELVREAEEREGQDDFDGT